MDFGCTCCHGLDSDRIDNEVSRLTNFKSTSRNSRRAPLGARTDPESGTVQRSPVIEETFDTPANSLDDIPSALAPPIPPHATTEATITITDMVELIPPPPPEEPASSSADAAPAAPTSSVPSVSLPPTVPPTTPLAQRRAENPGLDAFMQTFPRSNYT